jgi:hypothetical protein
LDFFSRKPCLLVEDPTLPVEVDEEEEPEALAWADD